MRGKKHWLWRAVDQDGFVLDVMVQRYRNRAAAKHLMPTLLKRKVSVLRIMIIDKLRSYAAAKREIMPDVEGVCSGWGQNDTLRPDVSGFSICIHP